MGGSSSVRGVPPGRAPPGEGRSASWLVGSALLVTVLVGAASAYSLVGYATSHVHVANTSADLTAQMGELVGSAHDLGTEQPVPARVLADARTNERLVRRSLTTLERSGYESEDVAPFARSVSHYLDGFDRLRAAAAAGHRDQLPLLVDAQDRAFRRLSPRAMFITEELRGSADDAAKLARNGVIGVGFAVAVLIAGGLWWIGNRRRRRARAEVEYANRARFEAIVEHSSDLITVMGRDGVLEYVSPAVARCLGGAVEAYVGRDVFGVFGAGDDASATELREQIEQLVASPGDSRLLEYVAATEGGDVRSFEAVGTNLLDHPAVRGVVLNNRDVTERKRLEARQQAILARSHDLTMFFEPDGTIAWASPASERLFGKRPETLVGENGLEMIHPDDRERVIDQFLTMTELGSSVRTRFRVEVADDDCRWVEEIATNLVADPAVGYVVGNLRDVTDEQNAAFALAASEARHRAILNTAHEGIWVTDSAGRTVFANPRMAVMLGTDVAMLVPRLLMDFVATDDRPVLTGLDALARSGSVERHEARLIRADGSALWVELTAGPVGDEVGATADVLHMVTDTTDRRRAEDELRHQALHDALTGLPNRRLLSDRLEHCLARRSTRPTAVLHLDLDNFKDVNDSLGHSAGDALLTDVAQRLRRAARSQDTVARSGGDEFVVLCEEIHNLDEAVGIAERLAVALRAPFCIDESEVFVSASVGISITPPHDASSLLRRADVAMYRAKGDGRDQVAIFDSDLDQRARERFELQSELRRALSHDEFVVWYQPIVDLETGRAVAVEALARWRHPSRGLLGPDAFIHIIEQAGLIGEFGKLILTTAARQISAWNTSERPLRLSVNVASGQLSDDALHQQVVDVLRDTHLEPDWLTLEITESAAMRDPESAERNLRALRDLGVNVALDDFGTGFSSLAFLKRLPVNAVKIDKSFVAGLGESAGDTQIVSGVISMAHALGHAVIAEGIETDQQLAALRNLGCRYGQGFYWSEPVHITQLDRVVNRIGSRDPPRVDQDHTSGAVSA